MTALVLALWAGAAEPADPMVDALAAELARSSTDLHLPSRPPPYYVAYVLSEGRSVRLVGNLGGLESDGRTSFHALNVEVRVGSEASDNSNFSAPGEEDGFTYVRLVEDGDPAAVRHDAWLATDGAYKAAFENLGRKEAARSASARTDQPASFAPGEAIVARVEGGEPLDEALLEAVARRLSAVFLAHPDVYTSRVHVSGYSGRWVLLDTRGARVAAPTGEIDLRVVASVRAADGRSITDDASWIVTDTSDLPPLEEMEARVEALADRLDAWRQIPASEEPYVGPVLFEDAAARALFRELLIPSLCGTPAPEHPRTRWGPATSQVREAARLKRRLLPPGWTVDDDPTVDPSLPSSYAYDDEGQPARAVNLVEDGVVRGLLMSRTPNDQVQGSNGHARSNYGLARAVPSNTHIGSDAAMSRKKLVKRGLKLAQTYDLDHVLVVRRLADPSLAEPESFLSFDYGATDDTVPAGLSAPIEMVRLYADGHEEPVAGLQFTGVDPRVLRDIDAAGPFTTGTYLHPEYSEFGFWPDVLGGFPVTLTAPDVLVSELELIPADGDPEPPPLLPSPLAR